MCRDANRFERMGVGNLVALTFSMPTRDNGNLRGLIAPALE
jgi:hypothetical protein